MAQNQCRLLHHLEPWQCSISYVKHTIFVYYDIDSILTRYRTSEIDVRYRDTILNSISNLRNSISIHYDIEESIDIDPFSIDIDSLRHRRNVDIDPFFTDIDPSRYRRNFDIELKNFDIGIYRYRTFSRYRSKIFRYQCTMSKLFRFDIECFLPRYLCILPGLL